MNNIYCTSVKTSKVISLRELLRRQYSYPHVHLSCIVCHQLIYPVSCVHSEGIGPSKKSAHSMSHCYLLSVYLQQFTFV